MNEIIDSSQSLSLKTLPFLVKKNLIIFPCSKKIGVYKLTIFLSSFNHFFWHDLTYWNFKNQIEVLIVFY